MTLLFSNSVYWFGVFVSTLFVTGGAAVLVAWEGDSPLIASAFALVLALLAYGFGWSGRCLLQGRG